MIYPALLVLDLTLEPELFQIDIFPSNVTTYVSL